MSGATVASAAGAERRRRPLPERVPPFNNIAHRVFTVLWVLALLVALSSTVMGLYQRYESPGRNSELVLGSRAGFAVSPKDATAVRFTVGPYSRAEGLRRGDDIIAIFGLPMPATMPVTEEALARHGNDPEYIPLGNLLFGTDEMPIPVTVRSPDGTIREITLTTGEQHINDAARASGFSPAILSFVDLLHVIFYPFLIWAAFILHRRNARDAVSSMLSLAILLMIAAELPSSAFLASIGAIRLNAAIYDLGNVLLIAGILLFPHGEITPRRVILLCIAPVLMLLSGYFYQTLLLGLLAAGLFIQIRCLRVAESSDLRQQIRWALFGFSGYAVFRGLSYAADTFKYSTGSFAAQMSLEVAAALLLGLASLALVLGLLVALIRYRLYDAEAIISRTATAAIVTIGIGGTFAAVMEGIITGIQFVYPESETSQTIAAMAGAVMAAVVIEPLHRKTREWSERRFHKALLDIREDLPEVMRDTRDSSSLDDFLKDVLQRIVEGLLAVRGAVVLEGQVRQTIGITKEEVDQWLKDLEPTADHRVLDCVADDRIFPLRLEVETSTGAFGWVLIGPRPDGSIAGKDEQKALRNVAATLGRSIRIVLTREEDREELMGLLEGHNRRIERLEAFLAQRA